MGSCLDAPNETREKQESYAIGRPIARVECRGEP